jgi:hypothetical protein
MEDKSIVEREREGGRMRVFDEREGERDGG